MYKIYSFFFDFVFKNLKFFFSKNKRFFVLSFIKLSIIFDKNSMKFLLIKGRNFYDYITIREIFINECYSFNSLQQCYSIKKYYNEILKKNKIPLIIDAGANIGASSIYFFNTFKESKLICFEPEKNNYNLLDKNFKNKFNFNSALGYQNGKVSLTNLTNDPRAFKFEKNSKSNNKNITNSIELISLKDLLNKHGSDYVPFILKVDIEGGEKNLFNKNDNIVDNFKVVIVEPHDWLYPGERTMSNFLANISNLNRDFIILNENIVSIKN